MNKLVRYNDTYWSLVSLSDECFKRGEGTKRNFYRIARKKKNVYLFLAVNQILKNYVYAITLNILSHLLLVINLIIITDLI